MKKWYFKSLKLSAFLVLSFVLSLFLSTFTSQEVSAFDLTRDVNWVASADGSYNMILDSAQTANGSHFCNYNNTAGQISQINLNTPYWTWDLSEYLEVIFNVENFNLNDSMDSYFMNVYENSTQFELIDVKYSSYSGSSGQIRMIFKVIQAFTGTTFIRLMPVGNVNIMIIQNKECLSLQQMSLYSVVNQSGGSSPTDQQVIQGISNIRGDIGAVNQSLDTLNQSQQATTDAIDNQTQQQQQQYEDEKQEEQDRENQGNADSAQMQGMFNFTAFNPFSGLFGLFTGGGGCVAIPTIASMLRSPTSTYCPWFSGTVRSILTPVIGISAMMLIFGFFVRWLNSGSGKELDING